MAFIKQIVVRNKLRDDIKDVSILYGVGNKLQSTGGLAAEYWFDWKIVNLRTGDNVLSSNRADFGDIASGCEKKVEGFQCSTCNRGYWQVYFKIGLQQYKIDKENAQVNIWDIDDNGEVEITILHEAAYIRIDFKLSSGNAYFYAQGV